MIFVNSFLIDAKPAICYHKAHVKFLFKHLHSPLLFECKWLLHISYLARDVFFYAICQLAM